MPVVAIRNVSVLESSIGYVDIPVTLDSVATAPVQLYYFTTANTAINDTDYSSTAGSITIPIGQSTGYIRVFVTNDTLVEGNEAFQVVLLKGANSTLSGNAAALISTVTILDNDDALIDPELTVGLPSSVTAATGMDALTHAIEALTTKHLRNSVSDALAIKAIELIGAHIQRAVTDGRDLEARTAMLEGAAMAGLAFANAPVGAVHALAHPLGDGRFKVPHGLANALLLPHVIRFNMPAAEPEYARVSRALGWDGDAPGLPQRLMRLNADLKLPAGLHAIGINEEDLPLLVSEGMKVERLLANNVRTVTANDAADIFRSAWR